MVHGCPPPDSAIRRLALWEDGGCTLNINYASHLKVPLRSQASSPPGMEVMYHSRREVSVSWETSESLVKA